MLGKRKRKCFECSNFDETTKTFPANTRETLQKQWIDRMGLSHQETMEKLEIYREKLSQGTDIRWCSKHFVSGESLPIDLRSSPPLVSTQLREELQPHRLNLRYRNPIVCTTPVVSDSEMDMDEPGLATPPPLSPIRPSSIPLHPYEDLQNESMSSLPKRFKREASIRDDKQVSENYSTQESQESQVSEYFPSQETNHVSEEEAENSDNEECNKEGEGVKIKYRLVGEDQLRSLFRRCQECGVVIDRSLLKIRSEGSACVVEYDCITLSCKTVTWKSQERIGIGRSTVFEGNQELSIGAFISGVPIPRLADYVNLLGIGFPSERTMRRMIRDVGCPAIQTVFDKSLVQVRTTSKNTAKPEGIAVSIDGQYDHPGFNAMNCKVTVMDADLKVVLAASSLNKREAEIEGKSIRMESVGALRAMRELVADGFKIKVRVTDQNAMVDKKLREHPDTASIEGELDWWHVMKPLKKKWRKEMKSFPVLAQLYSPFFNHLYYCHTKYTDKNDRPKALELLRSYLFHIQGTHSWTKEGKFSLVFKCDHEALKRKKKGEPARPKLKANSEEYKIIEEMLNSKTFEKAFMKSSPLIDTALNESFHALSLMYATKRFACSPFYYDIKMKLSILHYNCLVLQELTGERKEKRAFVLSRPGRVALSVKTKRDPGHHPWKDQILKECVAERSKLEEERFKKRIGMPEDYVFDELMEWETDEEEGEEGEDEVYGEDDEASERSIQL